MKALDRLKDAGHYQKHLKPKESEILYHHHVKHPKRLGVAPLLYQHAGKPPPSLPRFLDMTRNGGPIIIAKQKNPDKLFERVNPLQKVVLFPELRPVCH